MFNSEHRRPAIWIPGHFGILEVTDIDVDQSTGSFRASVATDAKEPEQVAPLSMIHPVDEDAQIQLWTLFVEKLIERLRRKGEVPSDYRTFTLSSETDWSGDPTVVVKLLFEASEEVPESKVAEWSALAAVIQTNLIRLFNGTTPPTSQYRFPFVSVGAVPKGEYAPCV